MNYKKYLPATVGIILLIICFYDYDFHQVGSILRRINYYVLLPAATFELINLYVRSQRLKVILTPVKHITGKSIFSYYSIGTFANAALPALSGQVVRVLLFSRKYKISKTSFATGAIIEILFDGLCLFGLMVGISFIVKLPAWMVHWEFWVGAVVLGCIALFTFIAFGDRKITNFSQRFEGKISNRFASKISTIYQSFSRALMMLKSSRHITTVSFLSLLSWALNGVVVYLLFLAFGFSMGPWAAYLIVAVNSLALMIVVTPGNLGTFNLACVLGLSFFGVDKTQAISFSILLYITTFLPVMLTGLIFTLKEGVSLVSLKNGATSSRA